MSEYRKNTTNCKDIECLIDALVEMGYKRENIETHDVPQQLFDYRGNKTRYTDSSGDKANVIVRRQHVGGAANDLGFLKNKTTGTYDALISDYDSGKHNLKWLGGLKANYAIAGMVKSGKAQGLKFLGKKKVEGKTQLTWGDPRVSA
jgi:hypothetical protein